MADSSPSIYSRKAIDLFISSDEIHFPNQPCRGNSMVGFGWVFFNKLLLKLRQEELLFPGMPTAAHMTNRNRITEPQFTSCFSFTLKEIQPY